MGRVKVLWPEERQEIVSGLNDQEAALYRRLMHSPMMGVGQLAAALKTAPAQIEPILNALASKGLVEKFPPSKRRPFGEIWRPTADRQETVGDWIEGGHASRGYADLAAIQRDYPSVKTLGDFADGADQDKREADIAAQREAKQREDDEAIKANADDKAAREAARAEDRRDADEGTL